MPLRQCEARGCRSRNKTAVWAINGHLKCASCMEKFLSAPGRTFDDYRIIRLSDREQDFSETARAYTARVACSTAP